MATATALNVMTLGPQREMSATLLQTGGAQNGNNACVIVTTGTQQNAIALSPQANIKTVLIQQKHTMAPASEHRNTPVNVSSPATSISTNTSSPTNSDMLRCKRRINFSHGSHLSYPGHQPASVARRNARERNRVKQVNNGFATLRSHIPFEVTPVPTPSSSSNRGANKKLSKVETLRLAVEYIRSLQQLLDEHAAAETTSIPPTTNSPPPETTSIAASSDAGYYSSSPESTVTLLTSQHLTSHPIIIQQQQSPAIGSALSPPCSEASSSPTPSFASEGSGSAVSSYTSTVYAQDNNYDNYENYEPMSPEDEELLDVISWWQQSQ